jgi:hypothetical protein
MDVLFIRDDAAVESNARPSDSLWLWSSRLSLAFFFNATATTEIYTLSCTLSLHDALLHAGHEVRAVGWEFAVEILAQDVRYGVLILRKSPLFTAVAVMAIAIGIGGNTAMFSLVDAILLRPLPYPEPQRLIIVGTKQRDGSGMSPMGTADFLAWRDHQQSFEQVAVLDGAGSSFALSGMGAP